MAEGTFEYECMRAELLGIEPPDLEVFAQQQKLRSQVEDDDRETEELKQIEGDNETINGTTGKIDELNSILSLTQQKLNKFKRTCGSLTSLLKFRATPTGSASGSNENLAVDGRCDGNTLNTALETLDTMEKAEKATTVQQMKSTSVDMQKTVSSQISKLDSILNKAESASYAMQNQNKQMKKMMD